MTKQANRQIKTVFGENLKAARTAKGMTQRELAARVNGVDTLAVYRWEKGKARPSEMNLAALADALGISIADLYLEREAA